MHLITPLFCVPLQAVMQKKGDVEEEVYTSKNSRVYLVDLAGSERVTKSGATDPLRFQVWMVPGRPTSAIFL